MYSIKNISGKTPSPICDRNNIRANYIIEFFVYMDLKLYFCSTNVKKHDKIK
jgi:hypothetical protein